MWMAMFGGFAEATTPFIRVTDTYPAKTGVLTAHFADREFVDYKVIPQLMASNSQRFIEVAKPLLDSFPFVEINCGCPSPKVYRHGAGSQILQDPGFFEDFVTRAVDSLGEGKLAVKIRLGIDRPFEAFALLERIKNLPLRKLTIHGRTKMQGYRGAANWGLIQKAARDLDYPVVGSGDINSRSSYFSRIQNSNVASVIIGRGALQNPWVFREIEQGGSLEKPREIVSQVLRVFYMIHLAKLSGGQPKEFADRLNYSCDFEGWDKNETVLSAYLADLEALPAHRRVALGRLKMVWNYMRYEVCQNPIQAATCLRSPGIDEFMERLKSVAFLNEDSHKPDSLITDDASGLSLVSASNRQPEKREYSGVL
jgi:tRNA-dihydrouridine synthase